MALTPFDMEGVNRDLLAAGNPAKPDMQSILRRNARDLVLGNAISPRNHSTASAATNATATWHGRTRPNPPDS